MVWVNIIPFKASFDWNDLGSWDALESVVSKKENNTIIAEKVVAQESQGNIIYAPEKLVCLHNIHNLIVVSTDNTVMVLPKEQSQEVKTIVNEIKDKNLSEYL